MHKRLKSYANGLVPLPLKIGPSFPHFKLKEFQYLIPTYS